MGAVSSVVMVILACSPDMMLCREPASQPVVFASLPECNAALARRLAESDGSPRKIVGRCNSLPHGTTADRWGISPNGDLFSAGVGEVITLAEVSAAAPPRPKAEETDPVTIHVTRNTPTGTETTAYIVSRN